jgi:16S rRNA (cytidine1402-2'-O)-methyltransferase
VNFGTLYVVSTPIGNLGDLSVRATEVLRSVALVLAEDTRHARTLLKRYEIRTSTAAYHQHNEARITPTAITRLLAGEDLALISDAGTPLLSDPGARLVRAAIDAGVPVSPVPGASACLAALVASGLPTDRFTFFGFLQRRGVERRRTIAAMADLPHVSVLFEAPTRVGATLADLVEAGLADRPAVVAREMTKRFEEFRRGTVGELATYYGDAPIRGEVVIVVGGATAAVSDEVSLRERVRTLRAAGTTAREIVATLVADGGVSRNVAYRMAHESDAGSADHS